MHAVRLDERVFLMGTLSKDAILAGFDSVWSSLAQLGASLSPDEWEIETRCPGWTVRDNFSHIIGTERMLMGESVPDLDVADAAHINNDIGRANEAWIVERRGRPGADVLVEFNEVTGRRRAELEAKPDSDFDAASWTPAGNDTYGRFMRIRIFDTWLHSQDIREAVGRSGGMSGPAVEFSLDELATTLGFVVGKKAGVPQGSSVAFLVTSDTPRRFDIVVDGRASLSDEPVSDPTVTLEMPLRAFASIMGGRRGYVQFVPDVVIGGDAALGQSVLDNMPTTI